MTPRICPSRIGRPLTGGLLILSSLTLAACGVTDPEASEIGRVVFVDVEGGCWGLDSSDGRLEPRNLPDEFKVDGLRVRFQAVRVQDAASVCQIGSIVDLVSIRRLP